MVAKAAIVCVVIALVETLHGILRVRFLNSRLGDHRARQISVFTGSAMILLIGWFTIPWIGPSSLWESLAVGALWLILMLTFDLGLGRLYFGFSWRRLAMDFDVRQGGFLGFGMTVLFLTPLIIATIRGLL
jgi:hypothetical protein